MSVIILRPDQLAEAEAMPDPKRIWIDGDVKIIVYTGEDLPEGGEE